MSANQVAEVNCLGGLLPRPLGTGGLACLGGGITATTTAATPELGADATASLVYAAVTHVDVIKEITQTTVLGLLGADAHIDSISQSFLTSAIGGGDGGSPTPEPLLSCSLAQASSLWGGSDENKKVDYWSPSKPTLSASSS